MTGDLSFCFYCLTLQESSQDDSGDKRAVTESSSQDNQTFLQLLYSLQGVEMHTHLSVEILIEGSRVCTEPN